MISNNQSLGFSTVELLVALFVAAAFIGTAFQLYFAVTKSGGDARVRSEISSIAYENIRNYSYLAKNPCGIPESAKTPTVPPNLPSAAITVTFTCPYGAGSRITRINAKITYGTPQETIEESLDVIK